MTPLIIHHLAGSLNGQRQSFSTSPLSFGRSADNDLVVELPHASRRHGMLVFENGQWMLVNQSPNGTTVNRRRIGDKPHPLHHGDVIGVGKEPLFAVAIEPSASPPAAAPAPGTAGYPDQAHAPDPQADHIKRRTRLWMGIGIYLGIMLIVMVVLSQVIQPSNRRTAQAPKPLTRQQIADVLNQPLQRVIDQRKATTRLQDANTLFNQRTRNDETLYNCFIAYKEALAYSGKTSFDSVVQLKYVQVRDEFIDRLFSQYMDAYLTLRDGQTLEAERKFKQILLSYNYPNLPDLITENIKKMLLLTRR